MGRKPMHFKSKRGSTESRSGLGSLLRTHRGALWWTVSLSLIGGLAEAAVLVLIVDTALSLSNRSAGTTSIAVGPIHLAHVSLG
ncbi:MAG TPA: hypothetical protein VHU17_05680, partial [Acidimicrobiales bacterium]|nr:hypothetical protein [Acidimicrobiales bacterium]